MSVELPPQEWAAMEQRFPGCSAAFDRDLGERWLAGRDGPRFDIYGPVLKVFVGENAEYGHKGPWASASYDAANERWIVTQNNVAPRTRVR